MPELPHHLSVSGAETWEDCPRKWHAKYVLKIRDEAGPEAEIGKMAHAVLEHVGAFAVGKRTPQVALSISRRAWKDSPPEMRRVAMGHVLRALNNLEVAAGEVVLLEAKLETVLAGVPFLGYLDRADALGSGALTIIDYKTGKRKVGPRGSWLLPKKRQLAIYAAAVETIHGRPVHQGRNVWTAKGIVDEYEMDNDTLAEALAWLRGCWDEILDAIEADHFPANPGPLCSWCSVVAECPEGTEAVIARSKVRGKSIGAQGQAVLDGLAVKQFEDTLAAAQGVHLRVVTESGPPVPPDGVVGSGS